MYYSRIITLATIATTFILAMSAHVDATTHDYDYPDYSRGREIDHYGRHGDRYYHGDRHSHDHNRHYPMEFDRRNEQQAKEHHAPNTDKNTHQQGENEHPTFNGKATDEIEDDVEGREEESRGSEA